MIKLFGFFLISLSSITSFAQDKQQIITVDSLKKYLSGDWIVREKKCWDKQYNDTISRRVRILNDNFSYTEIYKEKIHKRQEGKIKIDSINSWYKLSVYLDNNFNTSELNMLTINIELDNSNLFQSYWIESHFENSQEICTREIGNFIFIRKE